jgi:hypothetical protein
MVSKIDQYGDLRNGILQLNPSVMLSGKEQVARRESKAPSRRRPSVDLHMPYPRNGLRPLAQFD